MQTRGNIRPYTTLFISLLGSFVIFSGIQCRSETEIQVQGTWVVDSVFTVSDHNQIFLIANLMIIKSDEADLRDEITNYTCKYEVTRRHNKYYIKFNAPTPLYHNEFEIKYWVSEPRRLIKLSNSEYEIYGVKMFDN